MTNLKIRLRNQHPIQGRAARGSQTLIQNFQFVPVRWLKINLSCFCFQKQWNIIHWLLKKKTIQDVSLSSGFCNLPWDHKIWFKTMSLTPKLQDRAGLLKCEISLLKNILWEKQVTFVCTYLVNALVKKWYELIHFTWKSKQLFIQMMFSIFSEI